MQRYVFFQKTVCLKTLGEKIIVLWEKTIIFVHYFCANYEKGNTKGNWRLGTIMLDKK